MRRRTRGRQDLVNDGSLDNGRQDASKPANETIRDLQRAIFGSGVDREVRSHAPVPEGPNTRHRSRAGIPDDRTELRAIQRIAFRELSNSPPLTRSCQEGSDAISLDSAFYVGLAIAFCDGSRIHGDADRGDLDCAEKNEMSSHLLYGTLSSRCLKPTRSECSDAILVFGLSLVIQAATQNSKACETDRQDARDHNGGGRHAAGVQASLSVRARRGLIQILEAIPAARRRRGVNGRSTLRSNS